MRREDFSASVVVRGSELGGQYDGTVPIVFGEEYSLRLRTHHGRRGVAHVWIDGVEVTGGGIFIDHAEPLYPLNYVVDLETPPATPGKRFRFVSAESAEAKIAGKGGRPDDGVIKIEFRSEKTVPTFVATNHLVSMESKTRSGCIGPVLKDGSSDVRLDVVGAAMGNPGVTVAGSSSSQRFHEVHLEVESRVVTITLKLVGIPRPTAATTANYCANCGRSADRLSNICACGSQLR